jgi:hypothetical protein
MTFNVQLFNEKLKDGDEGERCFAHWAKSMDTVVAVNKVPHGHFPYDFSVTFTNGNTRVFEVKTACPRYDGKPWVAFTAETCSLYNGKEHLPEYRKHVGTIDYIVYFDKQESELYFYDAVVFAEYVAAKEGTARMNQYDTAKYVFVPKQSIDAGFVSSFKFDGSWTRKECV